MPQMGESIAEGTVAKWLKNVGDAVSRDEPILEISTDKVDAEIPAPAGGTLVEIAVAEGQTVEVGTIVAYIDSDGGPPAGAPPPAEAKAVPARAAVEEPEPEPVAGAGMAAAERSTATSTATSGGDGAGAASVEERLRTRSTPVVRRIAAEHGIDVAAVPGTGHAGRVTKQDILGYIEAGPSAEPAASTAPPAAPARPAAAAVASSDLWRAFYGEVQHPEVPVRPGDRVEPMDKIRRLTAEHMVLAKRVAPHVHSFIEIDFSAIDRVREASKARWAEQGARVSYTAFVAWAVSRVLREFGTVNAAVSGNNVVYRGNVNLGFAVDLDPGLIVPVARDADHLSLVGLASRIVDLAERARARRLMPEEIQGATFSITNPGVLGTLVGMPVIPKGTSAILGTGAIEKRVVVVTDPETGADAMAIRKRSLFSLGYDHRIVDGADAARFLARLKDTLQTFPEDA
jgi:2-oxoglutarate dehydrogenase E2 component (dihydrolipoamide succinyltransferase)